MLNTAFTRLLGVQHPIMQAPMGGGISAPELAAAVSNAGGLGMLAVGGLPPDEIRAQIRRTRRLTDRPFGVNLLLPMYQPGQAEVCIEERIAVLSFFWGDAAPHVSAAHEGGVKVMLQVGSVDEAQAARDEGEVEKTALYAGQSCELISDLLPAAVIVEGIARDAEARLRNLPKDLCAQPRD